MNVDNPNGKITGINTILPLNAADYGWQDLKGHFVIPASGTTAGTRELKKTGVYSTAYNNGDVLDWGFHIDHFDVLGGDKYLHLHSALSDGSTASGNNLIITAGLGYSRHNRTGSPAAISKTFTITPAALNAAANGTLVTPEVLIAQTGGGTGLWDSSVDWVVDDDISLTLTITQFPTITGGLSQKLFIAFVDIHRQVRSGGTRLRVLTDGSFD